MSEDYIPIEQEEEDLASDEEDTISIPGPVSSTGVAIPSVSTAIAIPSASTAASTYQTAASFSHNFILDFLNGYVLLHTLVHALQCALFALTLSIPAQYNTLRPP
jgi:hypothetical protein